jgi:hypothetical protein
MKLRWAVATMVSMTAGMLAYAVAPAMAQSPWPQAQPQAQPEAAQSPWPQAQQPQAAAQSPWPQAQPQVAQPAWAPPQQPPQQQSGPDPWSAKPQQEQMPPCLAEFVKLRAEVEKRGGMIKAAGERKEKPSPKEACGLFNAFTAAEAKMIKYAVGPGTACGIPAQVVDNMKQAHAKSSEIRGRVCQVAAAGPPRPAAPNLSDALSAPVPNSNNIKTGRGTFDTLTGSPLGK